MRSVPRQKLSDAAIKAWRITTLLWMVLLIFGPFSIWAVNELFQGTYISPWLIVALGLFFIAVIIMGTLFLPEIRWRRWFYQIDEHEVDLQSGIIIVTRTLVPVKRVQHVDTRQGPILRAFNLADVTISTAATTHRIPALDEQTADQVRNQISKFARLAKEDV